jgi:hypothetical protein
MRHKSVHPTLLFVLLASASMLHLASPAYAQADQVLPPMGGPGGSQFFARCANGDILNGVELRTGNDVDGIRPICASSRAPTSIGPRNVFSVGYGGDGGGVSRVVCPDNAPAIAGLRVGYEGEKTTIINNVHLYCSVVLPNQPLTTHPTAVFDGPRIVHTDPGPLTGYDPVFVNWDQESCPKGLVPVGINGRSGVWLDAVGLICGAMPFDPSKIPPVVSSIGRVGGKPSAPRPPMTLCERARDARARNSPAAANLEAQCQAGRPVVSSLGRDIPSTPRPAGPPRSICAAAADARSRNSPAAPNLEAQCRATGGTPGPDILGEDIEARMVRGEAMASEDALTAELRNRTPEGPARRGFDIGLGVWEGNTAPGPGKQRFRDVLGAIEKQGFDIAAAFALPRNKHAELVNVGAAIASADAGVAEARATEDDVFFWLGFDIATGIFGDPALGARGNTATGAGSLGIRNELSAAAQRGFNASVALHLSRSYR